MVLLSFVLLEKQRCMTGSQDYVCVQGPTVLLAYKLVL